MSKKIFVKVFLISLVFYLCLFFVFQFFADFRSLRFISVLMLIATVSVALCRELAALTGRKKIHGIVVAIFFLFGFYEAFKFSRYIMGDLPRYLEQPIISAVVSFFLVVLYVGALNLVLVVLRKIRIANWS